MWEEHLCKKSSITIYDFENYLHDGFSDIFTGNEMKEAVKEDWLPTQVAHDLGIQKLVERFDKCLNKNSSYVEMLKNVKN